mgnify:CR=1 FL=1
MEKLVGKKIVGLQINKTRDSIKFILDQGELTYSAYGDCCSKSWFADILGVDYLLGGTVIRTTELQLPFYNVDDGRGRAKVDEAYGYQLDTDIGSVTVVFRNSSSGFYCGTMSRGVLYESFPQLYKYLPGYTFREITRDWAA